MRHAPIRRPDRPQPAAAIHASTASAMHGFAGDTLASALLANGVHLVGRSFKYHRPRGFLAAGSEEPNALVDIDRGNGRARRRTCAPPRSSSTTGWWRDSQNRWPVAALRPRRRWPTLAAPLLPAGFYYKTFMWPAGAWHRLYEPLIRRTAGLGRAPKAADPDHYAHHYRPLRRAGGRRRPGRPRRGACRGGRAGGAGHPVRRAGRARRRPAGRHPRRCIDGRPGGTGWRDAVATLRGHAATSGCCRAPQAFGYYAQNLLGLAERLTDHLPAPASAAARAAVAGARQAGGARDRRHRTAAGVSRQRPPGVMLAAAARTYLTAMACCPASAWWCCHRRRQRLCRRARPDEAGAEIAVIADLRATRRRRRGQAAARGGRVCPCHGVAGISGGRRVAGACWPHRCARMARRTAPSQRHRLRPAADGGRLDAGGAPVLPVARQAALRCRARRSSCPARYAQAAAIGRRLQRHVRPGGGAGRGRTPPARGAARRASPAPAPSRQPAASTAPSPPAATRRRSRPSSISRTTSPPRISSWRCARASTRSSMSSATPPPAWRPTRARPPT